MNVIRRMRYLIPLENGNTINVLVEEQGNPRLYKFAAVLDDWDEGCMFETGNSVEEAVGNLADLINVTLPEDWIKYEHGGRLRSIEVAGAAA
jgi:predicted RNase H-like HicB family nuclease